MRGIAGPVQAPATVRRHFTEQRSVVATTLDELFQYMLCTFPGVTALKGESARTLRSPIFNAAVDSADERDHDVGVGCCLFTNKLSTGFLEEDESLVSYTDPRVMLDVWI